MCNSRFKCLSDSHRSPTPPLNFPIDFISSSKPLTNSSLLLRHPPDTYCFWWKSLFLLQPKHERPMINPSESFCKVCLSRYDAFRTVPWSSSSETQHHSWLSSHDWSARIRPDFEMPCESSRLQGPHSSPLSPT